MLIRKIAKIISPFFRVMDFLTPMGDLIARVWVAQIFLKAGILKLESWYSTVALFENVYHVPILSPYVAAVLGTATEIILPILLILGLGGRFWILCLFIYNIIAVISYPFLLTPDGASGLAQHISWGMLLMLLMFHGPGELSLDHLIEKRYGHHMRKKSQ